MKCFFLHLMLLSLNLVQRLLSILIIGKEVLVLGVVVQIPLNVIGFLQGSIFSIFSSRDLIRLKKTREAYSGITGVHQENFFDIFTVLKFNEETLKFFNFLINQDGVNQWQNMYANPVEWVWFE